APRTKKSFMACATPYSRPARHSRACRGPSGTRMNLHEYVLLAASSLFVIIDPIAIVPAFLAMTPSDSPQDRIRMARMACVISALTPLTFAPPGELIFNFLGITIPAFQL